MKKSAIVFLLFSFLLTSCGAKKNVSKQSEKIALQDQGVLVATDAETEKPTLGLLWQNDKLQITLNQGRQLDFYRAETDLTSCGAKKNVVTGGQEPAVGTLEQRIAAGEFAWLDTIPVDTEYTQKLSGTYRLAYQNDLYGKKIADKDVLADSLILLPNGYYYKYKKDSLVDYGKYNVSQYQRAIKICMEQYKTDPQTMMYTDEIISYDGYWGVWGISQIYFTFISYNTTKTTYLGLYSYSNNLRFKLHFDVKMGDCYHYQWSGSNQIEWIRTD